MSNKTSNNLFAERQGWGGVDGSLAILHDPRKMAEYDAIGKGVVSTLKAVA